MPFEEDGKAFVLQEEADLPPRPVEIDVDEAVVERLELFDEVAIRVAGVRDRLAPGVVGERARGQLPELRAHALAGQQAPFFVQQVAEVHVAAGEHHAL